MPISDIIKYGFGVVGTLLVLHGPLHLQEEMRKMGFQILREASRTDDWGQVSIFAGHGIKSHIHPAKRLMPIK